MSKTFIYVVDRDFGFAPNPFHGTCTLATCKPRIRSSANVGDWVIGVGGRRLNATGRCVFAMHVSQKLTFDEYWNHPDFQIKKPARNGSAVCLVGDNIYRRVDAVWKQADSHHSNADGTPNLTNLFKDTSSNSVLASSHFYYFGENARNIPSDILSKMGYVNARNHRTFDSDQSAELIEWLLHQPRNYLHADPHDFLMADARYSGIGSRIARDCTA